MFDKSSRLKPIEAEVNSSLPVHKRSAGMPLAQFKKTDLREEFRHKIEQLLLGAEIATDSPLVEAGPSRERNFFLISTFLRG